MSTLDAIEFKLICQGRVHGATGPGNDIDSCRLMYERGEDAARIRIDHGQAPEFWVQTHVPIEIICEIARMHCLKKVAVTRNEIAAKREKLMKLEEEWDRTTAQLRELKRAKRGHKNLKKATTQTKRIKSTTTTDEEEESDPKVKELQPWGCKCAHCESKNPACVCPHCSALSLLPEKGHADYCGCPACKVDTEEDTPKQEETDAGKLAKGPYHKPDQCKCAYCRALVGPCECTGCQVKAEAPFVSS